MTERAAIRIAIILLFAALVGLLWTLSASAAQCGCPPTPEPLPTPVTTVTPSPQRPVLARLWLPVVEVQP